MSECKPPPRRRRRFHISRGLFTGFEAYMTEDYGFAFGYEVEVVGVGTGLHYGREEGYPEGEFLPLVEKG